MESTTAIALLIILVFLALISVKVAKKNERLAVIRMGRFFGVRGPGICFAPFFIDKVIRIDLDSVLPGWQGWSETEIEEKIRALIEDEQNSVSG
jgi:regulator of protease activity HflC (stomatin/prohibitin superfamily)